MNQHAIVNFPPIDGLYWSIRQLRRSGPARQGTRRIYRQERRVNKHPNSIFGLDLLEHRGFGTFDDPAVAKNPLLGFPKRASYRFRCRTLRENRGNKLALGVNYQVHAYLGSALYLLSR